MRNNRVDPLDGAWAVYCMYTQRTFMHRLRVSTWGRLSTRTARIGSVHFQGLVVSE